MAIARVALPVAAHQTFDYWLPEGLDAARGAVVRVRLGQRRLTGVIVELVTRSELPPERVLPVESLVPGMPPLPVDLLDLAAFVSTYYQQPLGLCLAQMLPPTGSDPRAASAAKLAA